MNEKTIEQIKDGLDNEFKVRQLKRGAAIREARARITSVVDFILLGLPLVAPVPNLINLAIALSPVMGIVASSIAAIAFELLLFGSAEIILYLQDKQMRKGGYEIALKIGISSTALLLFILLCLIAAFEVPLHGLAVLTLPFVSVISLIFLSLKRWADLHEILETSTSEVKSSRVGSEISHFNEVKLSGEIKPVEVKSDVKLSEIEASGEVKLSNDEVESEVKSPKQMRRNEIEMYLTKNFIGHEISSLNKKSLGEMFGVSGNTIKSDLDEIRNRLSWNGVVK